MFASIAEKMIISCNNLSNFKNRDEFSNYIGTTKNDLPFGLGGGRASQFANKICDNLSGNELSFLQNKLQNPKISNALSAFAFNLYEIYPCLNANLSFSIGRMANFAKEYLNKEITVQYPNMMFNLNVRNENLLKAFNEEFGRPINLHPEKQHQANIAKEQQKPQFNESNKQKEQLDQKPKGILVNPENRRNNKKHVTFALPPKESNNKLIIKELSKFLTPENKLNNHKKHVTFALPAKENNNKLNIKELGSKVFNPKVKTNNENNHRSVKITPKILPLKVALIALTVKQDSILFLHFRLFTN